MIKYSFLTHLCFQMVSIVLSAHTQIPHCIISNYLHAPKKIFSFEISFTRHFSRLKSHLLIFSPLILRMLSSTPRDSWGGNAVYIFHHCSFYVKCLHVVILSEYQVSERKNRSRCRRNYRHSFPTRILIFFRITFSSSCRVSVYKIIIKSKFYHHHSAKMLIFIFLFF